MSTEPVEVEGAFAEKQAQIFNLLNKRLVDPLYALTNEDEHNHTHVSLKEIKELGWPIAVVPGSPGNRSKAPVLVIQGLSDKIVLPEVTRDVYNDCCREGSEIHLLEYPAKFHGSVMPAAAPEWLEWMDARFRGEATTGKCDTFVRKPLDQSLVKNPPEDD
ncbi:hypothetical protein VHEMI01570 [[Torrubiella] hemipterigena]|uniref:Peptidase S9 prolyl oligopeptidase catalytic domain-containing protein n=1 Tax=[Torrubiella] hemipterigena TaxID=1531966 RepID=A0A0A1SM95_9HYPO|nr:hypothetical protein VHEMI01570 [[Torrubiella] hemipterigena]